MAARAGPRDLGALDDYKNDAPIFQDRKKNFTYIQIYIQWYNQKYYFKINHRINLNACKYINAYIYPHILHMHYFLVSGDVVP